MVFVCVLLAVATFETSATAKSLSAKLHLAALPIKQTQVLWNTGFLTAADTSQLKKAVFLAFQDSDADVVAIALSNGKFFSYLRKSGQIYDAAVTDPSQPCDTVPAPCVHVIAVDSMSRPITPTSMLMNTTLNVQTIPWFQSAMADMLPWSSAFFFNFTESISLSYSMPLTAESGYVGVASVTVALDPIVSSLKPVLNNYFVAYIVDSEGYLIVSNDQSVHTTTVNEEGVISRVKAIECSNLEIRQSSILIDHSAGGWNGTQTVQIGSNLATFHQLSTDDGIDWDIVIITYAVLEESFNTYGSPNFNLMVAAGVLCIFVTGCNGFFLFLYRKHYVWKASHQQSLWLFLLSQMIGGVTCIVLTGRPVDRHCKISFVFVEMTVITFVTSIIVRLWFYADAKQQILRTTDPTVIRFLALSSVEGLILLITGILSPEHVIKKLSTRNGILYEQKICSSDQPFAVVISAIYLAILVVVAFRLNFKVRSLLSRFSEHRMISFILYHEVLLDFGMIGLWLSDSVEVKIFDLVEAMLFLWYILTSQAAFFGPRWAELFGNIYSRKSQSVNSERAIAFFPQSNGVKISNPAIGHRFVDVPSTSHTECASFAE
eukprot:c9469_g1_i2.p1 GENE.c9469_g1_i2~~c9469_g1_i2.p1  ORF type:complete len:603 (-),score=108.09 c9469_g1_i2:14-1822(-)